MLTNAKLIMLRAPLASDYIFKPQPPVLLDTSKAFPAVPALQGAINQWIDSGTSFRDMPSLLARSEIAAEGKVLLAEAIAYAAAIVGNQRLHGSSVEFRSQTLAYGEDLSKNPGAWGLHSDYAGHCRLPPNERGLHIVVAAPFSTIILPNLQPVKTQVDASYWGEHVAPDDNMEHAGGMLIPAPAQWAVLQEGTPHTTPRLDRYVKSREQALRLFQDNAQWHGYFTDVGFTRLYAAIDVQFEADAHLMQPIKRETRAVTPSPRPLVPTG